MKKHFVHFFSPGTFFAEETVKPISAWKIEKALKLARSVIERYGAKPYAFQFRTRERGKNDLDSREIARSGFYFLGGEIKTLAQIKRRNNPEDKILISNMECNNWKKIVTNDNSWRWVQPLSKEDVVLNVKL